MDVPGVVGRTAADTVDGLARARPKQLFIDAGNLHRLNARPGHPEPKLFLTPLQEFRRVERNVLIPD